MIWPYRDWVIEALNDDMPFDQFTIEQLAGDMLPGATLEQRIATGFHRNTMLNEEGGVDPLEFRLHAVTDRVATTGTVWLGLTLDCCQCHTHKFDPIAQREYYQICRVPQQLRRADDRCAVAADRRAASRESRSKSPSAKRRCSSHFPRDPLARAGDKRPADELRRIYLEARFHAWLKIEREKSGDVDGRSSRLRRRATFPCLTVEPDGIVFVSGDKSKKRRVRPDVRRPT